MPLPRLFSQDGLTDIEFNQFVQKYKDALFQRRNEFPIAIAMNLGQETVVRRRYSLEDIRMEEYKMQEFLKRQYALAGVMVQGKVTIAGYDNARRILGSLAAAKDYTYQELSSNVLRLRPHYEDLLREKGQRDLYSDGCWSQDPKKNRHSCQPWTIVWSPFFDKMMDSRCGHQQGRQVGLFYDQLAKGYMFVVLPPTAKNGPRLSRITSKRHQGLTAVKTEEREEYAAICTHADYEAVRKLILNMRPPAEFPIFTVTPVEPGVQTSIIDKESMLHKVTTAKLWEDAMCPTGLMIPKQDRARIMKFLGLVYTENDLESPDAYKNKFRGNPSQPFWDEDFQNIDISDFISEADDNTLRSTVDLGDTCMHLAVAAANSARATGQTFTVLKQHPGKIVITIGAGSALQEAKTISSGPQRLRDCTALGPETVSKLLDNARKARDVAYQDVRDLDALIGNYEGFLAVGHPSVVTPPDSDARDSPLAPDTLQEAYHKSPSLSEDESTTTSHDVSSSSSTPECKHSRGGALESSDTGSSGNAQSIQEQDDGHAEESAESEEDPWGIPSKSKRRLEDSTESDGPQRKKRMEETPQASAGADSRPDKQTQASTPTRTKITGDIAGMNFIK